VVMTGVLASALTGLDYVDQGQAKIDEALAEARRLDNASTLALTLSQCSDRRRPSRGGGRIGARQSCMKEKPRRGSRGFRKGRARGSWIARGVSISIM